GFASTATSGAVPSVSGVATTTALGCFDGSTWLCSASPISLPREGTALDWLIRRMHVSEFDFSLPDDLIAQQAAPRGESRLFLLDRGTGTRRHATIAELSTILVPGDVLVLNNTRVIAARLLGSRTPTGGMVECLL